MPLVMERKRPVTGSRLIRIPSMAEDDSILRARASARLEGSFRYGLVSSNDRFMARIYYSYDEIANNKNN